MKVLCTKNIIDDELAERIGLSPKQPRIYHSVSAGKEYMVLGISFNPALECYGGQPVVEVRSDNGMDKSVVPLCLFRIVDDSASRYWRVRYDGEQLDMLPPSFYGEYYHDDLSEGEPQIAQDFKKVYALLEKEDKESGVE